MWTYLAALGIALAAGAVLAVLWALWTMKGD